MAEYKIIISDETSANSKNPVAGSESKGSVENAGVGTTSVNNAIKGAATYVAVKRTVVSAIKSSINFGIGTVSLRTGENERQQKLQFAYDTVTEVVGAGMTIAAGAMAGGAVGAALAVVGVAVAKGIEMYQSYKQLEYQNNLESISLSMMNKRAGRYVSVSGSR